MQRAAIAISPWLKFPVRASRWHVVSESSFTVSGGEGVSFSAGSFSIVLASDRNSRTVRLAGIGFGAGVGGSALPADVSGDPQGVLAALPKVPPNAFLTAIRNIAATVDLPSWNSPIYLCPGRSDSPALFQGLAQIVTVGGGLLLEISGGLMVFYDNRTGIKAFAFLGGVDFLSNASVGAGDIVYMVSVR